MARRTVEALQCAQNARREGAIPRRGEPEIVGTFAWSVSIQGKGVNADTSADVTANMIGRSNARRGARRMFAVLQNRRLNQHIVYTVLDEVCSSTVVHGSKFTDKSP